jgi:hypothetical protein
MSYHGYGKSDGLAAISSLISPELENNQLVVKVCDCHYNAKHII